MRADEDGSAAAASKPASRFAGTLMEILDKVEYSRVPMEVLDNPVYRLRYEAYRREEFVQRERVLLPVRQQFPELPGNLGPPARGRSAIPPAAAACAAPTRSRCCSAA